MKFRDYLNEEKPLHKLTTTELIKKIRSLCKEKGIEYSPKEVHKMTKLQLVRKAREVQNE